MTRPGDRAPLVLGNLDCEARWSRVALPARVLSRISAAATLLRFLFDEPIDLWTPATVDPRRVLALPGHPSPRMLTGPQPQAADGAWAAFAERPGPPARDRWAVTAPAALPAARRVNDRRFAAELAQRLGVAPAGAAEVRSLDELARHLAAGGADASPTAQWICKAPLSAAGRDRVIGGGAAPADELERAVARLLQRFGTLMFEPWLERVADLGVCALVDDAGVTRRPPHTMVTSERGGFLGIRLGAPPLSLSQQTQLDAVVDQVGASLAEAGYRGPFAVDAFLHRTRGGEVALRPLCEINGRLSFGWLAAAAAERLGARELGFSPEPPPGATVLVAGAPGDVATWVR